MDQIKNVAPSDHEDRMRLVGKDPMEDFTFVLDGRWSLWDNGMYLEVFGHRGLGDWFTLTDLHDESEDFTVWATLAFTSLPSEVQTEYIRLSGGTFPAPGADAKRLRAMLPDV